MNKKIPQAVLEVLSRCTTDGTRLYLPGTLDRKMYVDVNKVLEAAGATWKRGAKAHITEGEASDLLDGLIMTGEYAPPARDTFDFFPTPAAVVAQLLGMAGIELHHRVLEPSAGNGAILRAIGPGPDKVAIELNPKMVAELARAAGSGVHVHEADFLSCNIELLGSFDRIVMNPPFSRRQDVRHIMHAAQFLKPGGRLVAVASSGVTFRDDRLGQQFRALVEAADGSIEPLPDGSFKESGTMVNTVIVTING